MEFIAVSIPLVLLMGHFHFPLKFCQCMKETSSREQYISKQVVFKTVSSKSDKKVLMGKNPSTTKDDSIPLILSDVKTKKTRIFYVDVNHKKPKKYVIDSTLICAICWTGYVDGDTACLSQNKNCSHIYHEACVVPWLMKRDDCPMCRSNFLQRSL